MTKIRALLNRNTRTLCAREPYFAPNFEAARRVLDAATVGNGELSWLSGATCGPHGCDCGDRGCLHPYAWRIFNGK